MAFEWGWYHIESIHMNIINLSEVFTQIGTKHGHALQSAKTTATTAQQWCAHIWEQPLRCLCMCVCAMATPCIVQSGPRGRVCLCVWVCALWPTHQSIYVLLLWFIKTYSRGKCELRGGELSRHRRADGRKGKPCGDGSGMECLPAGWSDCETRLCSCNVTCIFRSWRAGNRSQKCQQPVPCELQWNLLHDPKSSRHTCEFGGYLILISEYTEYNAFYRFVEHMFTLIDGGFYEGRCFACHPCGDAVQQISQG